MFAATCCKSAVKCHAYLLASHPGKNLSLLLALVCRSDLSTDLCLQIINIQTLGSANGTGVFFPNGYVGRINSPAGYAAMSTGLDELPSSPRLASQVSHLPSSSYAGRVCVCVCACVRACSGVYGCLRLGFS